ncbi:MAG: iron chelate uptake ABC transporter family permease subunit [Gammaproteobacteria bacterium]|nr:iron chelate uptake ABC transporter family permease subunit [Gammaproteobacteria bacterium]
MIRSRGQLILLFGALFLLALACISLSLVSGSIDIGFSQLIKIFLGEDKGMQARIIMELRLPRVLSGFIVGGLLSLAGALMQVLLKNPLAEPYVLGVSGGASVFALLAMVAGVAGLWLNLAAFSGALLSIAMVFGLARLGGSWSPLTVLLTGIVVAAGWGAVVSFLLAVSPAAQIHGMLFWLMGDLEYSSNLTVAASVLISGFIITMAMARNLNLMARGEQQAAALGVAIIKHRYSVYFLASMLTATAVMQAGNIGFIGLIVPHLVRLLIGSDHRLLLPVSLLLGGSLLVIADALARIIISPQQLPVGVLTAMIGVPLFLFLLHKSKLRSLQ